MDEFTTVALWLMIALMSINVVFTWLTVNDGLMALRVAPDSVFASDDCTYFLEKENAGTSAGNTVSETSPSTSNKAQADFSKSYSFVADTMWTLTGGWAIALDSVFNGGVFGDSSDNASLGYLFSNLILPFFIIAQTVGFLLILYRALIAGKGLFGFG